MLKNFFLFTMKGLRYRPMRSWLTVVGIVIGIMLVVIILSLGDGIKRAVSQTLQMFGSDLIYILPGKETNPLLGFIGEQKFREQDIKNLTAIDGVKFVLPMEAALLNVEYRGEKKSIMVHAGPWRELREAYESSQGFRLERGRWPDDDNLHEAVIGYNVAHKLFKNNVRLNDEIIIRSKRMKIVGIVAELGLQEDDNLLYISLEMLRSMLGSLNGVRVAAVKIRSDVNIDLVARQIRASLEKQEVVRDFSVLTPEKANRLVGSVLDMIELGLVAIASIALIVGAVGIMNTMYTSVLERTKQIGIMKAVGASNDAIQSLFLIESGLIGAVGGIFGIILGIGVAFLIGVFSFGIGMQRLFSFAALDIMGLFSVLVFTFIVGILSGVLPARQAARMEPAEALRYE